MSSSSNDDKGMIGAPQTYIIAQNPAVLAHLMRENEKRGMNPSAYTTPASVFNVLAVDFDGKTTETTVPTQEELEVGLKTLKMPAMDLMKLDNPFSDTENTNEPKSPGMPLEEVSGEPTKGLESNSSTLKRPKNIGIPDNGAGEMSSSHSISAINPYLPPDQNPQQEYLAMNSPPSQPYCHPQGISQLPPPYQQAIANPDQSQQDNSKSKSLERNMGQNIVSAYAARINSLERRQIPQDYNMKSAQRSQSLIRQYSAGFQQSDQVARSASLERQTPLALSYKSYTHSLDKNLTNIQQQHQQQLRNSIKGGSLERSQAIIMNDMVRKYYEKASDDFLAAQKSGKVNRSGSLEKNSQYAQYLLMQKAAIQQQLKCQQKQVQEQQKQILQQQQQNEIIEENIYDFGGVHVKSCATIALKKSIERGMLPPNAASMFPQMSQSNCSINSNCDMQQNLYKHPPQPSIGIASRMLFFQQQQQQSVPNSPKIFSKSQEGKMFPKEMAHPQIGQQQQQQSQVQLQSQQVWVYSPIYFLSVFFAI